MYKQFNMDNEEQYFNTGVISKSSCYTVDSWYRVMRVWTQNNGFNSLIQFIIVVVLGSYNPLIHVS